MSGSMTPNNRLKEYISNLDSHTISEDRRKSLNQLVRYIKTCVQSGQPVRLLFVCTHNSRRSHLCQIWAQTMAYFFHIKNVETYSGGTESTALYPTVVDVLNEIGFDIENIAEGANPVYSIKYDQNEAPVIGFSKSIYHQINPKSNFGAVMTCSHADEACPMVIGSDKRISITYEDPKLFDGTAQQLDKYRERSLQIATEMYYVFSCIKAS